MYPEQFSEFEPEPTPPGPSFFKRFLHLSREILETIVPAVLIALLINLFLAQATRVYGQSMEPNLHTDQRLIVEKLTYNRYLRHYLGLEGPERGDVVVIDLHDQGGELLIKRVIGLPGDTVEIRDRQVYVNNLPLNEPYLDAITGGRFGPITVPPLHIFVLGDNRGYSNDSRSFGTVALEQVIGRAWFSYWPPEDVGFVR
jgi:signal peptidase I